ncbi:hypothetical protein HDU98_008633 [Podochytrium sp. JEL0797]|nr:hypothetical protein HDU98_008633 [Podochytrium sp. JEL0797]
MSRQLRRQERQSRVTNFIESYQSTVDLASSVLVRAPDSGLCEISKSFVTLWDHDNSASLGVAVEEYSSPSTRVGSPETVLTTEEMSQKLVESLEEAEDGESLVMEQEMECLSPASISPLSFLQSPISPISEYGLSQQLDWELDIYQTEVDMAGWGAGGEGWDFGLQQEAIPEYVAEFPEPNKMKEFVVQGETFNFPVQTAKNLYLLSYAKLTQSRTLKDHFAIGNFMKRLAAECPQLIGEIEKDRVAFQRNSFQKQLSDHETEVVVVEEEMRSEREDDDDVPFHF